MSSLIAVLAIATVAYVVLKWLHRLYLSKKWGCKPIYKVRQLPLGLEYPYFALMNPDYAFDFNLIKNSFDDRETNTYKNKVVHKTIIDTKSSENLRYVLTTKFDQFSLGTRKHNLLSVIGNGIFATEGERWKSSRLLLKPQFTKEQVSHIDCLESNVQNFARIIRLQGNKPINLEPLFLKLTLDLGTEFLFGEPIGALNNFELSGNTETEFEIGLAKVSRSVMLRLILSLYCFLANTPDFKHGVKLIRNYVQGYVDKALNIPVEKLADNSNYIFLYELVKYTRDPEVIREELLSIMFAGRDTTASLLNSLFYELSRNPEIWNKLKSEIYREFGDGDNVNFDNITFESMKKCTYLKWCINEALRLYPPIPLHVKSPIRDISLPQGGGKHGESPAFAPKDSIIFFHVFAIQRLQEVYGKDADTFRPERWENLRPGWNFMPFGAGPRICLGQQFALTEASYITLRLAQMFPDLTNASKEPADPVAVVTISLKGGNNIIM